MKLLKEIYLTDRFFISLWAIIFGLLISYVFPFLFRPIILLFFALVVLTLIEIIRLFAFGQRMNANRTMTDKFSNGENNPVSINIVNDYPFKIVARLIDEIPVEFQVRDSYYRFNLEPREDKIIQYNLRPVKRGVYCFGKILIFISTRFNLIERRLGFDSNDEFSVYPSFMMMKRSELIILGNTNIEIGENRTRYFGGNMAFEHIKHYVIGDDPRTINWKATAKQSSLMVNTYTEDRSQQVYCLIDKGRTMQSPFNGMTMLDHVINSALSLSNIILKKGDKAGVMTFSNKFENNVKADNRTGQLNRVSEALHRIQTNYLESDFERLYIAVKKYIPTRSLLVLFTNIETMQAIKRNALALKKLASKHLLLVVLFENTELNKVIEQPSRTVRDVYFETVATGFTVEKRQIVRELMQMGIQVILTKPESLTLDTINKYLEIKSRGLI